jgi:colicin import membrane protein
MTASYGLIAGKNASGISLGMILVSLFLHIFILSIIFFVSPSLSSPKLTFGPIYNVQLVNIPANLLTEKPEAATKETMETGLDRQPVVLKKKIDSIAELPKKKKEVKKMDRETEKALDEIRKRLASSAKSSNKAQTKISNLGALSQVGNQDVVDRMQLYYALIWSRIKSQWALPQSILHGETREAIIDIQILRNGMIADTNFEKRSGNSYFDDSALKAIKKASPLPPLPDWIRDSSIEVGIRFHSSDLK